MSSQIIALVLGIIAVISGLWKYFGRKSKEKRERIDAAKKISDEGRTERDPSKVTAGFNRINRDT